MHFLPPYSSEFNPIERVWAMMKREWAQYLITLDFQERLWEINRYSKEDLVDGEDSDGKMIFTSK